jgi:hypothetical protein
MQSITEASWVTQAIYNTSIRLKEIVMTIIRCKYGGSVSVPKAEPDVIKQLGP